MEKLDVFRVEFEFNTFDDFRPASKIGDGSTSPLMHNRMGPASFLGESLKEDEYPDLRYFIASKPPFDFEHRYVNMAIGFFISVKAMEVLSSFNLSGHNIIQSGYILGQNRYNHAFLFPYEDMFKGIDFTQSRFALISKGGGQVYERDLIFNNKKDIFERKIEGGRRILSQDDMKGKDIVFSSLCLPDAVKSLDLFLVRHSYIDNPVTNHIYFASPQFKVAVEAQGLTGITFIHDENLFTES